MTRAGKTSGPFDLVLTGLMGYTASRFRSSSHRTSIGGAMTSLRDRLNPTQFPRSKSPTTEVNAASSLTRAHLAFARGLLAMDWPLASPGQSPRRHESWEER